MEKQEGSLGAPDTATPGHVYPTDPAQMAALTVVDGGEQGQAIAPKDIESGLPAWLCVLGSFLFLVPSYGWMQSVGTIQSYLQLNQLADYTTSEVGWITGMYVFLSLFFNIQIGPICDYYGPRVVGSVGVVCTVACFFLLAECKTYWQFMLCHGVFGAIGGATDGIIAISVVAKLFTRRRGLAMGIALTGSSAGSIIYPIILRETLPNLGWEWSMRIVAFATAGMMVIGLLCFIPFDRLLATKPDHRPSRKGGAALNLAAFRSPAFSFVAIGLFMLEFAIFAVSGLLPTIATGTGFSPEGGYTLIAILGACSCVGRVMPGLIGDKFGHFNIFIIMIGMTIAFMGALFVPFASTSKKALYAFSALWGFGSGSMLSMSPVCMGKTCEAKEYGRYYGTMNFFVSFALLVSIPLSGMMLENMGVQALAGLLTAVVFLGGGCYFAARALLIGQWLSPRTII